MACLAGCIALGVAMAKLVEYPALTLRDRIFPSQVVKQRALTETSMRDTPGLTALT